jgi:FkbM family methyltransferase
MNPLVESVLGTVLTENHLHYLAWCRRHFGGVAALQHYRTLRRPDSNHATHSVPGIRTPVYLRPGTSDQEVFVQVFLNGEYDLDLGRPSVIVDAGANVGLSTLLFANRYPETRVIAIEPDPANFSMLTLNTQSYTTVSRLQCGLWSRATQLAITNPTDDPWGFRVVETIDGDIPALGVRDVMEAYRLDRIDVLKMDVEGAEREILSTYDAWGEDVGIIIVETHDDPLHDCSETLDRAVQSGGLARSRSGENHVLRRPLPA